MPVFVYCIAADVEAPPAGTGYVRAESAEEAVALVEHPETNVYPLPADAEWPGEPGAVIHREAARLGATSPAR